MSKELTKTKRGATASALATVDRTAPALDFGHAWDYAPAPEATDHIKIAKRHELFIGGKWRAPRSGKYFATISPSTEEKLSEVAEASPRDVDDAVKAARHAHDKVW